MNQKQAKKIRKWTEERKFNYELAKAVYLKASSQEREKMMKEVKHYLKNKTLFKN